MGEFEEVDQAGEAFVGVDDVALGADMQVDAVVSESQLDARGQTEDHQTDYPQVLNPEFLSGGPQV